MANSCVLTMYYADCTGNAKNNKYSHRIDVVDTASLMECVSHDYVCAEFSNYRSPYCVRQYKINTTYRYLKN